MVHLLVPVSSLQVHGRPLWPARFLQRGGDPRDRRRACLERDAGTGAAALPPPARATARRLMRRPALEGRWCPSWPRARATRANFRLSPIPRATSSCCWTIGASADQCGSAGGVLYHACRLRVLTSTVAPPVTTARARTAVGRTFRVTRTDSSSPTPPAFRPASPTSYATLR